MAEGVCLVLYVAERICTPPSSDDVSVFLTHSSSSSTSPQPLNSKNISPKFSPKPKIARKLHFSNKLERFESNSKSSVQCDSQMPEKEQELRRFAQWKIKNIFGLMEPTAARPLLLLKPPLSFTLRVTEESDYRRKPLVFLLT